MGNVLRRIRVAISTASSEAPPEVVGDVILLEGDESGDLLMQGDESGGFILDVGFGAAAVGFLGRTTGLDATHTAAYGELIDGLVLDGVWGDIDILYIFATQDSTTALLNIRSTLYNATAVGSPTFTANQGFTGATGKYINTNWNPATQVVPHYRLNDAHWMVRSNTNSDANVMELGNDQTANHLFIKTGGNGYARFHGGGTAPEPMSTSQGTFLINRNAASVTWYRNGTALSGVDRSLSGGAIEAGNMFLLALNQSGSPANGSTRQMAAAGFGGKLSTTHVTAYNARLAAFLTAVGAP